jgi:hypothetical protein
MIKQTMLPVSFTVIVAPVHLRTLEDIRTTFGRTEETVKKWYHDGAPISFDGSSYSAEYNSLQAWLVQKYGKRLELK